MAALEGDQLLVRVVYTGPPLAGKTRSIRALMSLLRGPGAERLVLSPGERDGRTAFFDWADYEGGTHEGRPIRCQIVSTPGQVALSGRRKLLLLDADAVIMVVASQANAIERAAQCYEEMAPWLAEAGRGVPLGLVLQCNKQDLPGALAPEELSRALQVPCGKDVYGTSATTGRGLRAAFVAGVRNAVARANVLAAQGVAPERHALVERRTLLERLQHAGPARSPRPAAPASTPGAGARTGQPRPSSGVPAASTKPSRSGLFPASGAPEPRAERARVAPAATSSAVATRASQSPRTARSTSAMEAPTAAARRSGSSAAAASPKPVAAGAARQASAQRAVARRESLPEPPLRPAAAPPGQPRVGVAEGGREAPPRASASGEPARAVRPGAAWPAMSNTRVSALAADAPGLQTRAASARAAPAIAGTETVEAAAVRSLDSSVRLRAASPPEADALAPPPELAPPSARGAGCVGGAAAPVGEDASASAEAVPREPAPREPALREPALRESPQAPPRIVEPAIYGLETSVFVGDPSESFRIPETPPGLQELVAAGLRTGSPRAADVTLGDGVDEPERASTELGVEQPRSIEAAAAVEQRQPPLPRADEVARAASPAKGSPARAAAESATHETLAPGPLLPGQTRPPRAVWRRACWRMIEDQLGASAPALEDARGRWIAELAPGWFARTLRHLPDARPARRAFAEQVLRERQLAGHLSRPRCCVLTEDAAGFWLWQVACRVPTLATILRPHLTADEPPGAMAHALLDAALGYLDAHQRFVEARVPLPLSPHALSFQGGRMVYSGLLPDLGAVFVEPAGNGYGAFQDALRKMWPDAPIDGGLVLGELEQQAAGRLPEPFLEILRGVIARR